MDCTLGWGILEQLTRSGRKTILCGGGELARNFRRKLLLLGMDVPFTISDFDSAAHGVSHCDIVYSIDNFDNYQFVLCLEPDEIHRSYEKIRMTLMKAARNNGRALRLFTFSLFEATAVLAGKEMFDIHSHRVFLRDGKPFVKYGEDVPGAYSVHVLDSSVGTAFTANIVPPWPEILHRELRHNIPVTLYNWSMSFNLPSDYLVKILRDVRQYPADLIIWPLHISALDNLPSRCGTSNLLRARVGTLFTQWQVRVLNQQYGYPASVGNSFAETPGSICGGQLRVFKSLAKTFGFTPLVVVQPQGELLPSHLIGHVPGMRKSYLKRMEKLTDYLKSMPLDILDCSHIFDDEVDFYDVFIDWRHFTTKGAERFAQSLVEPVKSALAKGTEKSGFSEKCGEKDGDDSE